MGLEHVRAGTLAFHFLYCSCCKGFFLEGSSVLGFSQAEATILGLGQRPKSSPDSIQL